MGRVQQQISLQPKVRDTLKFLAEESGLTMSAYIEKLVMDQVNMKGIPAQQMDAIIYAKSRILQSPVGRYVKKIILFGSCARGDARFDSDIDLMLILDMTKEEQQAMRRELLSLHSLAEMEGPQDPELDLVLRFSDDMPDNTFGKNVERDGRIIYES
ncbi:MAG: nucleotidyltransferase domain-containing protein [Pseudobutyrivibrio sp.]|nr:nucleotidyltransferase domain-containing protein [Pseudobutyrivibrio sp.]